MTEQSQFGGKWFRARELRLGGRARGAQCGLKAFMEEAALPCSGGRAGGLEAVRPVGLDLAE
jgi:hypothetical protein